MQLKNFQPGLSFSNRKQIVTELSPKELVVSLGDLPSRINSSLSIWIQIPNSDDDYNTNSISNLDNDYDTNLNARQRSSRRLRFGYNFDLVSIKIDQFWSIFA